MPTDYEIHQAIRDLTRENWETIAKSVVEDSRESVTNCNQLPDDAWDEDRRLYDMGWLD